MTAVEGTSIAGHGNRHSFRRVATEYGQFFDEWVRKLPAGFGWSTPVRELDGAHSISWTNLNGTIRGSAAFREPLSSFNLPASGTFSSEHTVHTTVRHPNPIGFVYPTAATALHDNGTGFIDDGYCVVIGTLAGPTPFIGPARINGGTVTLLSAVAFQVCDGDIVSLAYRYNTADGGSVNIAAMINGVVVSEVTDAAFAYDIATVTDGRFGLYGGSSFPIATTIGHILNEFWVTEGYGSFERIPSVYPALTRSMRLSLMGRQRFTTSPTPKIKALISGPLERCRWSYKRIGGCATLSASFRYPEDDDPVAASFRSPTFSDWNSGEWIGGELVLSIPFSGLKLDPTRPATSERDSVWRGRVTKIQIDAISKTVRLEGEGLFENLKEQFIDSRDYNASIRTIVTDVISSTAKSGSSGALYKYNASKIVGVQSLLDLNIRLEARAQSVKAILDKLAAYLPKGVVWGVDREGDFFLDQQLDPWVIDHAGAGVLTFDATRDGASFDLAMDLGKVSTAVTVLGKEDSGAGTTPSSSTGGRLSGRAESDRAAAIFGDRELLHTDSGIEEAGLAFKVALVRAKERVSPRMSAKLRTIHPFRGIRALYQSLTVSAPRVMIRDESGAKRRLRFYDDVESYSLKEEGSSGAIVTQASSATEQALERSWLVHLALKFDLPHPGNSGDYAFIAGRPADIGLGQYGWGSLWWQHQGGSNGRLVWRFTDTGGATYSMPTGINVDPGGLGTIVHLTVYRDSNGDFYFYDSTLQTGTVAHSGTTQETAETGPWRFFNHGRGDLAATDIDGDASIRHFWVFNAASIEALDSVSFTPVLDFIGRNNAAALHRTDAYGLLLYIPFREKGSDGGSPFSGIQSGSLVTPSYTPSSAPGTPDGDDFDAGAEGVTVADEKKWGGPLVFDAETITYEYDARAGSLRRDFALGELPLDGFATLAILEAQVEKMGDILKRVTATI